jgi:hypothetical protein
MGYGGTILIPRRPGRDDAQSISQRKSESKQTFGRESKMGLGTKTNRWLTGLVSCK